MLCMASHISNIRIVTNITVTVTEFIVKFIVTNSISKKATDMG